jgi:DNA invertase Pin-like site-specific DNA recombinase
MSEPRCELLFLRQARLHIYAAVAEQEARAISARTKAALAAAKAKGVTKDGRPLVVGRTGIEILAPKYRAEAKARAGQYAPIIRELQQRSYTMRGMAVELTKRKVPTPRGGTWHPQLVKRIVERLDVGT